MLTLVRHAMPEVVAEVPPAEWVLGAEGAVAAAKLAKELPPAAYLVASDEPKAWQTIAPAGPVVRDRRFREIWRDEPFGGNFRELRRVYVEGADHAGWEPRGEVADRFQQGIAEHRARAAGRPLVVASHGMALTLWLTAQLDLPDPGGFWAELRFPDVVRVDLDELRLL